MDIQNFQIPLIFVGVFVAAVLMLSFIYKFGIKEKSYEEAIAEQRQTTQALLGTKQKIKEKKPKKPSKKNKEKHSLEEPRHLEEKQSEETNVEEKLAVEVAPSQKPTKLDNKGKHSEKPHVAFKDIESVQINSEEKPLNKKKIKVNKGLVSTQNENVGKVLIKENLEVISATVTNVEDVVLEKTNKGILNKIPDESKENANNTKLNVNTKKQGLPEIVDTAEEVEVVPRPKSNGYVVNSGKEKKKKKAELNSYKHFSAAEEGPGLNLLLNLVRKAELSRNDIQILTDLLLNKQLEAPAVLDDWSEGKSDPVQKLKKQLAEKEKALVDEQEALVGVQAKMREIRNEQLTEKSALNQKIRGLEEALQGKQIEIQANNNKYQTQVQSFQLLQAQLNDERHKVHTLREELGNTAMLRPQLEIHAARVQECEVIMNQQAAQIQDAIGRYQELSIDRQRMEENYVSQLNGCTKDIEQKAKQIEELHAQLVYQTEFGNKQETELSELKTALLQQVEKNRLSELHKSQAVEEISTLQKQNSEFIKSVAQLKMALQEKEQSETNGSSPEDKVEILNLQNELSSFKNQLQHNENELKTAIDSSNIKLQKLQQELDDQKEKNNELRNKNWKVMEALNAAEDRLKKSPKIDMDKITSDVKKAEDAQKQFIIRLFPEIEDIKTISNKDDWQDECTRLIENYLSSLRTQHESKSDPSSPEKSEDSDMLAKIRHYQGVINDTEGMLNNLQKHIEQEELNWRTQLRAKDLELDVLKEKFRKDNTCREQIKKVEINSVSNNMLNSTNGESDC